MSGPWRTDIVRSFFLSLWGLFTLVLVFLVLLLVNELLRAGENPLDALAKASGPASAAPQARPSVTLGQREIQLFFADAEGRFLVPQSEAIDFTDSTVENCRAALHALILGPKQGGAPVIAPAVQVRGLYILENGELVIDFSREFVSEHARMKSAALESLLTQGVVATMTQGALQTKGSPVVRSVRFLVEGSAPVESFPAHISLLDPVEPDPLWLSGETMAPASGETAPDA